MADSGKAKIKTDSLEGEQALRQEMELRQEERVASERIEQQDLNQGIDTGTHSSTHLGVDWGPSYRVRHKVEPASPKRKQIEARAYELYLQRGREDGHDVEDWLDAENELKRR